MISYYEDGQSKDLARLQKLQKALVSCFFNYCDVHGLTAFLVAGSALGACRESDMIAWDDDIDVGMLRVDYENFIRFYQYHPIPGIFLQSWLTEVNYPYAFAKLRIDGTFLEEATFSGTGLHQGIFIDIFPFDSVPKIQFVQKCQLLVLVAINSLVMSYKPEMSAYSRTRLRRMVRRIAYRTRPLLPIRALVRLREWICHGIMSPSMARDRDVICFEMYGILSAERTRVSYSVLIPPVIVRFGEIDAPVPADSNEYLTGIFGDWRTPPPTGEQIPHHAKRVDFGSIDASELRNRYPSAKRRDSK